MFVTNSCRIWLTIKRGCVWFQKFSKVGSILHLPCKRTMGWLRLVGSLKLSVSFAEYRLFNRALLQKRPIILRSLLIIATPYGLFSVCHRLQKGQTTQTTPLTMWSQVTKDESVPNATATLFLQEWQQKQSSPIHFWENVLVRSPRREIWGSFVGEL